MQPLRDERARVDGEMTALENGGDYGDDAAARYQSLENQRDILDINNRTAFPPHISDSGQFEPGDARAWMNRRAAGENGPPDAFDRMSPEDQHRFLRANAPEYEQERAQEAARRDGQRRLPGVAGQALGETLAISTTPWMGPTVRASGRSTACASCGGGGAAAEPAARPRQTTNANGIFAQQHAPSFARSDGRPTYRGDSRTPEEIRAAGGFAGPNPNNEVSLAEHMRKSRAASAWVSTSEDSNLAAQYAGNPFPVGARQQQFNGEGGTLYRIEQPGGVVVDRTTAMQVNIPEGAMANREVAYSQNIPWSSVHSYARVTPEHLYSADPPTFRWVRNPDFVPLNQR